jgi:hypothetical protein
MAARLNLLFQTAPGPFLEKTVIFTDELTSPAAAALARNRIVHHVDLQPVNTRATACLLAGLHLYQDSPLVSYLVPTAGSLLIPKEDPPQRFVFLPEFTCCRLLVKSQDAFLRIEYEQGLAGALPPAGAPYSDSFGYWEHTAGELVGRIRATAVLVKEPGAPWTILMQQIVGTPGFEVVRRTLCRALRY